MTGKFRLRCQVVSYVQKTVLETIGVTKVEKKTQLEMICKTHVGDLFETKLSVKLIQCKYITESLNKNKYKPTKHR